MQNDLLSSADALPDRELLDRLPVLAANERAASVALVAHLAALERRPSLYAAGAYGSLFAYCTEALRLSEDAAYTRVAAARACRRFPQMLDLLASGALTLTSVRLIGPHLTAENHQDVISRAAHRSVAEVKRLVAELAPQPDVCSLVRKLPAPAENRTTGSAALNPLQSAPAPAESALAAPEIRLSPRPLPPPVVRPLAPERYRVQFTIDQETKDQFDRVQALLRREIPSGDPGLIFKRAIALLLDRVERKKLGKADRPRPRPVTRFETERDAPEGLLSPRDPASAVKRTVWAREEGRCGFISAGGRRCSARAYIEFHHQQPYGMRGESTVENMALRCWRHNQFEAQVMFGEPERTPRAGPTGDARSRSRPASAPSS